MHSFCDAVWPRLQIWNRDLDALAPPVVIERICERTGVDAAAAWGTTFRPLEGILFERLRVTGPTDWVLPLGIYHRKRRRDGLQWCPKCLAGDAEPFYRRRWRLALASTCPRHGIVLADRCHRCQAPASPHRGADPLCDVCRADRRDHPAAVADSLALQLEHRLSEMLPANVQPLTDLELLHPLAYFGLVRQVMTVVSTGERSQALRDDVAGRWGGDPTPAASHQLEFMSAQERHRTAGLTARLMRGWPWLFVAHCADARVWKSWAYGDRRRGRAPYAYASVVETYLTAPVPRS